MNENQIRRLTLVKRLIQRNTIQLNSTDENMGYSILGLHDALEWYLYLGAENIGVGKLKSDQFIELFDAIIEKLSAENQIKWNQYRLGLMRFNKARVEVKHRGTFPSRQDILGFHELVCGFIDAFTLIIFGITYEDISLSELIIDQNIKQFWIKAEAALKNNDKNEFLISLATVVYRAMSKIRNKRNVNNDPFFRIRSKRHRDSSHRDLEDIFMGFEKDIIELRTEIDLLNIGINMIEYRKLQSILPQVFDGAGPDNLGFRLNPKSNSEIILSDQDMLRISLEISIKAN